MPEALDVNVGVWWRFSGYEIRDSIIRPATGAELIPYDPWQAYRNDRSQRKELAPPYQSLANLAREINFKLGPANEFHLSPESEEAIVQWCSSYGLLGILPHRAQVVHLRPRWKRPPFIPNAPFTPTREIFVRTLSGWAPSQTSHVARGDWMHHDEEKENHLVPNESYPDEWKIPHALLQEMWTLKKNWEPLTKTWVRFFPNVPKDEWETFQYPMPLSEDFWHQYAEPVDAFVSGARALQDALEGLEHMKPLAEASEQDARMIRQGRELLHALLDPVSPYLNLLDEGRFGQLWVAKSLLSSFAMMVLQDISGKRRVLTCAICGKLFVSKAWQACYCSPTCRNTANKRTYRKKLQEKHNGPKRKKKRKEQK